MMQALYVNPSDSYNIHWPIVRGQLNLHSGPGGSLTAVLTDLEAIWSNVIQKHLDIPLKDLKVGETSVFLFFCGAYFKVLLNLFKLENSTCFKYCKWKNIKKTCFNNGIVK